MSTIIINLLSTNAAIALIVGAFATYIIKWLATNQGEQFRKYEGWAIAAVKAAEKAIPDDVPHKGAAKLDYALRLFTKKYEQAVGHEVGADESAKIDAWLSEIHEVLAEAGTLQPAEKCKEVDHADQTPKTSRQTP